MNQWIGLRENFNRKAPWFNGKIDGFRLRFSQQNQSIEWNPAVNRHVWWWNRHVWWWNRHFWWLNHHFWWLNPMDITILWGLNRQFPMGFPRLQGTEVARVRIGQVNLSRYQKTWLANPYHGYIINEYSSDIDDICLMIYDIWYHYVW